MNQRTRQVGRGVLFRGRQRGGAAIEYVIVSTFATFLAIAAVTAVTKIMKDKVKTFEEKLGVTIDLGLDFLR